MGKKKKMTIGIDDYIKANKKLAREEELRLNGGRWVAKDRPHKNLKKYDRKRDKKNFGSFLSLPVLVRLVSGVLVFPEKNPIFATLEHTVYGYQKTGGYQLVADRQV